MKLSQTIKTVYNSSVLHKAGGIISRAYHSSRIFSINTAGDLDETLGSSSLIKESASHKKMSCGMILPALQKAASALMHISLCESAIIALLFCLAVSLSGLFEGEYRKTIIFGLIAIFLLPLCFIKASLRSILSNSFIGKFFVWDFSAPAQQQNRVLLLIIGALAVIGGIFLPLPHSLLLPLIPVALLLIFYAKPIFFITLIMLCLPIFGTSVCMVLSTLLILSHWIQRIFGSIQKQGIDYVDILFSIYVILCLLASVFSFVMGDSLRVSSMWIVLFSVVFIIYRNITTCNQLITVIVGLFIGALYACGVGLCQYLSGQIDTTWTDTELFEELSIRIYGTFANPNVFGEFLLLVIPFAVGMTIYFKEWKYKIVCLLISVISFITLALTYSRGCYAGIAVTAVIFLWMYNKKILGALLIVGTPIGIMMLPQNILDRISSMVNLADSSTSYRLKIYEGTFNMLGTYWPSGVGIGEDAFNYVYPFFGVQGIVAPHSHSLFLQLLVSFGIAGFAYFLIMIFLYHRNIISLMHTLPSDNQNRIWLIVFGSTLFGFLTQSIFDYTWYNYRIYMLFWIIFTLGLTAYKIFKRERGTI